MWKKFGFYTAELLQSADPGSPLYAIQVPIPIIAYYA